MDPFHGFPFAGNLATGQSSSAGAAQIVNTKVDSKETSKAHVFMVDLPGLKKEEIKVEVKDEHVFQTSGERCGEKEEKNDKWHRVARRSGRFVRRFRLPKNAKMDQVKAAMVEYGVLEMVIPKVEEKNPAVKAIEISG